LRLSLRPRKIRWVNLTDDAWEWLAAEAQRVGISHNDYLEALAQSDNPLMETVKPQSSRFMETAQAEIEFEDVNITQQPDK
jgi:hypothetical protein